MANNTGQAQQHPQAYGNALQNLNPRLLDDQIYRSSMNYGLILDLNVIPLSKPSDWPPEQIFCQTQLSIIQTVVRNFSSAVIGNKRKNNLYEIGFKTEADLFEALERKVQVNGIEVKLVRCYHHDDNFMLIRLSGIPGDTVGPELETQIFEHYSRYGRVIKAKHLKDCDGTGLWSTKGYVIIDPLKEVKDDPSSIPSAIVLDGRTVLVDPEKVEVCCFRCKVVGHIARECIQGRHVHTMDTPPTSQRRCREGTVVSLSEKSAASHECIHADLEFRKRHQLDQQQNTQKVPLDNLEHDHSSPNDGNAKENCSSSINNTGLPDVTVNQLQLTPLTASLKQCKTTSSLANIKNITTNTTITNNVSVTTESLYLRADTPNNNLSDTYDTDSLHIAASQPSRNTANILKLKALSKQGNTDSNFNLRSSRSRGLSQLYSL